MAVGRDRPINLRPVPSLKLLHFFSRQPHHFFESYFFAGSRIFGCCLFALLLTKWFSLAACGHPLACGGGLVAVAGRIREIVLRVCVILGWERQQDRD